MKIFTIGFTRKSAEFFFGRLRDAGVKRLVDVRLNNRSQLSGFAKRDDLKFFLDRLCNIDYLETSILTPEAEMLASYRSERGSWPRYERQFIELISERKIEQKLDKALFHNACLLCSEHLPEHCHRRLVAEYLQQHWDGIELVHLT